MDKLYVLHRTRDNKRTEFYSEMRSGKLTYIIREAGGQSQDSVTTDPDIVKAFRDQLIGQGYMEGPL